MPVTINGNNITITGATIEVVNGANDESGVAYIIITPDGGVGLLPFFAQGSPGQPTLFPSITLVQHLAGETLPTPNPVVTLVDAGGAGLPAKYNLEFHINQGITGLPGTPSITAATDLAATPALGAGTEKYTLMWRTSDLKWVPTAQKVGNLYLPGTTIAATAFNATNPRLLASITIPSQLFDWYPRAFAATIVTGSVDTRVDLIVRKTNQASGDRCAYGKGLTGANAVGVQTVAIPGPPADQLAPGNAGTYMKVSAGAPETIYLRAEQVAGSSNPWSTPASPDGTTFCVEVAPLL